MEEVLEKDSPIDIGAHAALRPGRQEERFV
jgi:hypothetical protein